jgi:hypothetical protein
MIFIYQVCVRHFPRNDRRGMRTPNILGALTTFILIILVVLAASVAGRARLPRGTAVYGGAKGQRPIRWDGPADCLPKEMVAAGLKFVRGMIRESRQFGPANGEEISKLHAEARRLSRKYDAPMSGDQIVAMRDMEVAIESQTGGARALRYGPELLAANRGGEPVVAIAKRLRIPPMAVLRQILLESGHSPTAVRAMVANPAQLPDRLAHEAQAIFEADLGSRVNANRIRERSQAYEDALGDHLRTLGLEFLTENDLRRAHEASADPGPLLTPDFLLSEPAHIDGKTVHWIDAKDYPMYGGRLVARGLVSQATKYTTAFGPGAMVFSGGVMCNAGVLPNAVNGPAVLLLDGSHVRPRGAPEPVSRRQGRG